MAPSASQMEWRQRFLRWARSSKYASDYVGLSFLVSIYIITELLIDPFHRMFYVNDLNISFPHAVIETVPVAMNFVYALFVPLFIIILFNIYAAANVHKHHVTSLGIGIALALASTLTNIIKNMVGRPRPDLIARCKPSPGTAPNMLVSIDVCTQSDPHTLHDGWRSFPSGHSSFAFAGMGYLSLFLAGQLKIFVLKSTHTLNERREEDMTDRPIPVRGEFWKVIICLLPLLGAVVIAITRCQDYRHDVYDVSAGALLGWFVAYWSYRRYWPRLDDYNSNKPYPPPMITPTEGTTNGRLRDEEQGF